MSCTGSHLAPIYFHGQKNAKMAERHPVWSDSHAKVSNFLGKLYPSWSNLLSWIEEEAILDDVILLLAYYFDCEAPNLFVHPISETGQAQLDSAKVSLGGQAGDVPLVTNVYKKFIATAKRERHLWCTQNCVDYATVKKLDQAYKDLKCSTEGHISHRIIGSNSKTLMEKLHILGQLILKSNPEGVYIHDGRPGLFYLNVSSLERMKMNSDSSLSLCPTPPKYVLTVPSSSKFETMLTLTCDEMALKSGVGHNRNFQLLLSRATSKVVICTKVSDCGPRLQEYLVEDNCRRQKLLATEIWKQCGCDEAEIHVTTDLLTSSLLLYCPEALISEAKPVIEERLKIIKVECEANISDVDCPDQSSMFASITSGGYLVETDSQPTYNRTFVLWVNSPEDKRKMSDKELTEEYVRNTVLKSVADLVAVRKFQNYPESPMWGLVIMRNTLACKEAMTVFNRTGGKYRLEWANNEINEVVLMFSVEKKLKNKVWLTFSTDRDFAEAKRFPWDEYWVMEAFFFDDRQAKFVFKRDRPDIYRLRNDIAELANVGVSSVKHENISPIRWPQEDLQFVEDELESRFKKMNYFETYDIQFLSRKDGDTQWKGVARFESYHKNIPDKFHRLTGSIPLRNDMVFVNNGVRDGLTMKVPRKVYYLLKKEIEKEETDFHGSVGVQLSDVEEDIVTVHFVWWNGGKMSDNLNRLADLLKPVYIYGIDRGLGEIIRSDYRPFKVMERCFQVAILSAEDSPGIAMIYGKQENRTKAAEILKSMLTIDNKGENIHCEIIPLHGPSVPSGLITTVINKYGNTLDKLQIISGCTIVHLDKKQHRIVCRGRPSDIHIIKEELDTCCSELVGNTWKDLFTLSTECVACLCPIEDPRNPAYHLEICGHSYCTECLISQINTQISQKLVPMTCVAEDCETKLCIKDILVGRTKGGERSDTLVKMALHNHLSRNRAICRPCPTPDCPMIFHLPLDDDKRFDCPGCSKVICIGCQDNWHAGLSCEVKKEINNLEDEKLKEWILTLPKRRKMCPSCKSGVEKMDGCDNVHCLSCGTSMCWRCLTFFKTSGECYDHIATKHRNEPADYNEEELLDYE